MTQPSRIAVLLYHNVANVTAPGCLGLVVTPRAFERQMRTLSALGFATVTPSQWAAHVRGRAALPPKPVMLTFDDAYSDLIVNAFPVLEKAGFTATVFVPTSLIGQTMQCRPGNPSAVMEVMSADEIATWSRRGIDFGAHTQTHSDLTLLDTLTAAAEIRGSRDDLAAIIGQPVTTFAYPFGKVSAVARRLAGDMFAAAFTIEEGMNDLSTPLAALKRTMVQHKDSVVDVCLRAAFGSSVLAELRTVVRADKYTD